MKKVSLCCCATSRRRPVRQVVSSASSIPELEQRLAAVQGPRLDAADRSLPLPVLRSRPAGEAAVRPWSTPPLVLPLASPGRRGEDRLRLRFAIDSEGALVLEGEDLALDDPGGRLESRRLGPVR